MSITARIAIIGAGAAGLTAARELQGRGARVVVYEAEGWVGGKLRTDRLDDFLVDTNAQLFGSMYTRFLSLVEELGIRDRLVRAPGRDALWRNGRVHEVVYGSVGSMLASGGLPLMTKLKLGTHYLPFLTRHAESLSLQAPERAAAAGLDDESIAAWGAREMGSDFVDYLVYPQLTGFYGTLPEETSAGMYHIVAGSAGVDVAVYGLRGGTATLCEALADRIVAKGGEIKLRTTVESLESAGSGLLLSTGGASETFDAVVMATPAPRARDLLRSAQPKVAGWLDGVRTRPLVTVALLLDQPAGVRWFGLSFPRDESTTVAAICVQENKGMLDLVPAGKGALVVFVRPDRAGELIDAESRAVVDAVLPDVFRAIPAAQGHVRRARVYRWPYGNAVMYPGYLARLGDFRRGGVEEGKVALAGDYLYGPSVEGAVLAGSDAAARLLARLGGA